MENLEYAIRETIGFEYPEITLEWQPQAESKIENSIYNFGALLATNEPNSSRKDDMLKDGQTTRPQKVVISVTLR